LKQLSQIIDCGMDIYHVRAVEKAAGFELSANGQFCLAVITYGTKQFIIVKKYQAAEHTLPAFYNILIAGLKE
jgi:hypothetical protein